MSTDFRAQQSSNRWKTYFLLACMFIAVGLLLWAIGSMLGMKSYFLVPFAICISLVGVWISYWKSDTLVLTMTGARVITHDDAPQLYNLVEEMTTAAGLPMPKVAIVDDPAPNAFATGRDPQHAVIAFTTGILRAMDREQLEGVTAHEMAHVANRDTLVMAVAATTAGLLAILADMGARMAFFSRRDNDSNPVAAIVSIVIIILAPIAALLLRAAVSRKRESLADATAVEFTRNPTGLRRALETLAADKTVVQQKSTAVAHVWIESPLDGKEKSMFDTHPPLVDRINMLRSMEGLPPVTRQ